MRPLLQVAVMRRGTYRIALGGVLSATAVGVLLLGSVIPFATYISPAVAALCVQFFCVEFDKKMAALIYGVISILSLLLAADKEQALLFAFVLGYYPIVKAHADKLRSKVLQLAVKLAAFNVPVCALYYVMINIFVVAAVRDDFAALTALLVVAMLVMANAAFFMFDRLITIWTRIYIVKLQPKLNKRR